MYVLAFGRKKGNIFEEGAPSKKLWSVREKNKKNIFTWPTISNLKVIYKIGCLQKTEFKRLKIDKVMDVWN